MSEDLRHHNRFEYCKTRLKYRQSKNLTAVKVYTVAQESVHLLIFGVPKINLHSDIKKLLQKYGPLKSLHCVTPEIVKTSRDLVEQFTDVFHATFTKIEHARRAKKFLDAKSFYGGILHISYRTEYEDLNEIRSKLEKRRKEVQFRIKALKCDSSKKQEANA